MNKYNISLLFLVLQENGVPSHIFLNSILNGLEQNNAQFIAIAIFAFLSLYLLWATTKGAFKFGLRIPFCCAIHPMKYFQLILNIY